MPSMVEFQERRHAELQAWERGELFEGREPEPPAIGLGDGRILTDAEAAASLRQRRAEIIKAARAQRSHVPLPLNCTAKDGRAFTVPADRRQEYRELRRGLRMSITEAGVEMGLLAR